MKLKTILLTGGVLISGWLAASYAAADVPQEHVAEEISR